MRPPSIFYGWWLSGLAGLVMVISAVPVFHGMAVWSVALRDHFGWNATQLGAALSLTRAEGALMGPLEGYLADKLGTKRMVLVGLLVLTVAFVIFSQVQALWMFYLAFILMSLGQGLGGWVPLMTMLNNWFSRRRGMAMGISMSVMTGGALLVVPAIAWAVELAPGVLVDDVLPRYAINQGARLRRAGLAHYGSGNSGCCLRRRTGLTVAYQNPAPGHGTAT